MRDAKINYILVGSFVMAMLVALVTVVAILTGRTGDTDSYYTYLANVGGLKYGTKVTYEGFPIGQVESIAPRRAEGKTTFRVHMQVEKGWPIPADSTARVAASGILAAVSLDIKGGGSTDMLAPGSDITPGPAANIFAVMNDVAGQVTDISQNGLKPLLATLNMRVDALGQVLEKQAPELMTNLVALSNDLAAKSPRITANVAQMSDVLANKVVNDANAKRMEQSLQNVTELTSGLKESRVKLDNALTTVDKLVDGNRDSVQQSLKDLRYSLQAVARNIDSISYNLEGTSRNMNEFSRQLRENPGVLIGGTRAGPDGPGKK